MDLQALSARIERESAFVDALTQSLATQVVGQQHLVERLLISLLAGGHVLLEGVPGLAKTLVVKSLAAAIDARFSRIQFTPDLLPADVLGTTIYNPQEHSFSVRKGPIFANLILADEINRAPAKVQSALLEAMQERQVTIGDTTFRLDEPFLVLATQNPIEQEGTYELPEAQADRFLMKVLVGYPEKEDEKQIIRQSLLPNGVPPIQPVVSPQTLLQARQLIRELYMDEKIENYIVNLVFATRYPAENRLEKWKPYISYGASPRASIGLAHAAKARAFLKRRAYVIPDDVRAVFPDVLRHRLGLSYEAEAEGIQMSQVLDAVLNAVEVP
ncbi:MAG: MoxR family ATPase [Sphingobacteriales bacterium]|nr:MAG: MoxR family ATPase [Sphingobacteriales bacterium]